VYKFKKKITLYKNNRGCYIIDTVKGCSVTFKDKPKGCYDNCYAKNIASRYKYDFSNPVNRDFYKDQEQLYLFDFYDTKHMQEIVNKIKKIDMPFIRVGEMGDPSEDWNHTINICKIISKAEKPIVIITKHWKPISNKLLKDIRELNICINTSVSALDDSLELEYRLHQFNRLKKHCNSVLRIVSCNFNKNNKEGFIRSMIQDELFKNDKIIDTIFRPDKDNKLVENKIINTEKVTFLNNNVLASVFNKNTYFGKCNKCNDLCGISK
jgi:hypothetical protein